MFTTHGQMHRALEEFSFLHCDESYLIAPDDDDDELQLGERTNGAPQSNRNSVYMMSRELHRPLLSMPPIVLMGAPSGDVVTPSPIVEEPPSPAPNQMLIIDFPCETLEGVLNSEDLMDDDDTQVIYGDDDDDTDVGEEDLEDDDEDTESYFAEGAIEVSCGCDSLLT